MASNDTIKYMGAVEQIGSFVADHANDEKRATPEERASRYVIDNDLIRRCHDESLEIVIFDDVLNTGSHFKAIQSQIRALDEQIPIFGIFVARVVRPEIDYSGFMSVFED